MSNDFYLIAGWRPIYTNRSDTLSNLAFDKLKKRVNVEPSVKVYETKNYHIHGIQPIANNHGSYWMTTQDQADSIYYADGDIKESKENCIGTGNTLFSGLMVGKYKVLFFDKFEADIMYQDQLVCRLPFKLWSYRSHCGVYYCRHPFITKGKMYVIANDKQLFRCNIQAINDILSKDRKHKQELEPSLDFKDHIVLVDNNIIDCCADAITGSIYYLTDKGSVMFGAKRVFYSEKTSLDLNETCPVAIAAIGRSIVVATIIKPETVSQAHLRLQLFNAIGKPTDELSTASPTTHEFISQMKAFQLRKCRILVSTRVLGYCDIHAIHNGKLHLVTAKMQVYKSTHFSIWDLLVEVDKSRADIIFVGFEIFNRITINIK